MSFSRAGFAVVSTVAVVVVLGAGCGGHGRRLATRPTSASSPISAFESPKRAGFYAFWERPRGVRDHTALVLLGGSEGGLATRSLAAALVTQGYPVLDLAYFREPGLPHALVRIRLEYFQRALHWLAAQPQVDPRRIVTFGISRGGELSLLLAAMFPKLVHGAVDYVGSWFVGSGYPHPREPAWTYHGKPLYGWPVTGVIPVWTIDGPVFAVGGGDDTLAQSWLSVRTIAKEMHQHGRHDVTALVYPHAGHLVGVALPIPHPFGRSSGPYGVITDWTGQTYHLGGSARADLAARRNAWPKLLRFLAQIKAR